MGTDIHISEVKNYLKCRLLWFWTAPPSRGLGLTPRRAEGAQYFGTLIHQALQAHYDTGTAPADCFVRISQNAGAGADEEALGEAMLKGYMDWASNQDKDSRYLALETEWSGVRASRRITLGGTFDALLKRPDGLWVLDFKTTKYRNNDWTSRDLQASAYIWAARKMYGPKVRGIIFRFLLKKAPQTFDELILKNGSITKKKNLSSLTTLKEYHKALAVASLKELAESDFIFAGQLGLSEDPTLQEYGSLLDGTQSHQEWYSTFKETYVLAQRMYHQQLMELRGPSRFFWDLEEYRTDAQLKKVMKHVIIPASKEMQSKRKHKWVGPTGISTFMACGNCKFAAPCKLAMDGADYRSILQDEYELRDVYR